ncbi:uncharacterized protein FOMMEDRAFT_152282 [Fomitiporia mediterranea MF3/22]|uniref:uncharacterized protein n=1 Tax=Fomitiporia mediterranea (strain MF3/22) TaxID=694068 RepID=UPI00044088CE|nr:uncharacterized protein FOMMEDRAFT_152282 [Fomitiporia mediterranea MF3/22]EJD06944.1 hypothetical protein FOMMEDRAFT_152282 [Fomitiporia mediterranea MF3/22]
MRETRTYALGWSQTGLLVKTISFFSSRQDHCVWSENGYGSNNCTEAPAALIRDTASYYAFDQSIFIQEIFPRMLRVPDSHIPQAHGSSSHAFRINELPTDILNEIFLRVVRIAQKDVASEESMLVPLRLSHVCRTWRHAVISCASLWAYINVLVDVYRSTEQDERLVKAVDTCIEMSKAAPLSLSVTCNTIHVPKPKLEVARYILNRLLGQQHRWRVANFAFKEMDPSRLPEIELINVPMLESLRISWRTLGASNMAQPQVRIDASRSPGLRCLYIKGIRLEISGGQLYGTKIHWDRARFRPIVLSLSKLKTSSFDDLLVVNEFCTGNTYETRMPRISPAEAMQRMAKEGRMKLANIA